MNHDAIDELLAGYALRTLSGEDAAEADRLLSEHVPSCAACRQTLDAFRAVTADLALDAQPADPPETLLPRLHREMEPRDGRRARWQPARLVAAAAGLVVVVGLGGLAATQFGGGGSPSALDEGDLAGALNMATAPGSRVTDVGPATEIAHPGVEEFYVYGTDIAQPPAGMEYALWLVNGAEASFVISFRPDENGWVLLRILADPTQADRLLVTLEPVDTAPVSPGAPAWSPAA